MIKICMTCKHRPIVYKSYVEPPKLVKPINCDSYDYTCPFLCEEDWCYNKMPDDGFYCGYWEEKNETD